MLPLLKKLYGKAGLDSSIIFTVLTKAVQSIGGIITLLIITRFLNKNEQGYYYTFWSILSIQIFFELGLTTITTQYIAHEAAHLSWKNKYELSGEEYYKSRLASIIRLSVKWFLVIAVVMFFVLLLAGRSFFLKYNAGLQVNWQAPWLVLSVATCCILITDLFFAILEGLGKIKEVTKLRLIQQLINLFFLYLFLFSHLKLLSNGLALLISTLLSGVILISRGYLTIIRNIWKTEIKWKINYRQEILPYQFRIGLGYISSYFIYYLFNPVLFATQGPVVAGQMGATQAVLNGIVVVSLSWISTKVALFSNLVAKKQFTELNSSFRRNATIAAVVCFTGIVLFVVAVVLLKDFYPQPAERFLNIVPMVFLGLTQMANVIGFSQGYYLRSFKKEPFFLSSIVMGILSGTSTVLCSKYFGINEITMSYFIINGLIGFIWGCIIFSNKKHEWTGR